MPRFGDHVELCETGAGLTPSTPGMPGAPGRVSPALRGSDRVGLASEAALHGFRLCRFTAFPALESYRGAEPENSGISRMDTGAWLQIILKVGL